MGNVSEYKTFNGQTGKGRGISALRPRDYSSTVWESLWCQDLTTCATQTVLTNAPLKRHSFRVYAMIKQCREGCKMTDVNSFFLSINNTKQKIIFWHGTSLERSPDYLLLYVSGLKLVVK